MIKQKHSIISVLFGRLMIVVATRLKMEIILFIKFYYPPDESYFISV